MDAKSVSRIVVIDEGDRSRIISQGPSVDVHTDPARPGFSSARMWVTSHTPVRLKNIRETTHLRHALEPPPAGSVCRIITFPPDETYLSAVGPREVQEFFATMGSPAASTYYKEAPNPYMQKTRTLDLCLVLDGEITLLLDKDEVHLKAGDTVVQRGTNHAWSNRSTRPCTIAISSHDAK
jgi:hypothetical protein